MLGSSIVKSFNAAMVPSSCILLADNVWVVKIFLVSVETFASYTLTLVTPEHAVLKVIYKI